MILACPHCGEMIEGKEGTYPCPRCGKFVRLDAIGKASFLRPCDAPETAQMAQAREMTRKAMTHDDPVKKHNMLLEAEQICPDCLETQTELLHLGRLYERNPKKLDYSVIKCHLLNVFETPDSYQDAQKQVMLEELVRDDRLLRCIALSPDQDTFIKGYLSRLCSEYITLFLKGSNQHMRRVLGFQVMPAERALANVSARMLINMERTPLPAPYDHLLPEAFLETFRQVVGSDAYLLTEKQRLLKQ